VIGAVLIVFAVAVLLINPPQQTAISPEANTSADSNLPTESVYPEIPRVSLADAKAAYDAKSAVFVDARSADSYAQGHIPGALSIPADQLANRLGELKKGDWIITYCT
jgi:3-mercaptopyruvate sulfurtransferase SseA